jgi:putative FmdB family regulatory protein
MPTYEYECKSCGHTFDAFQSMKDEPLKICPRCGMEVRRLIHGGTGVIFKGSGFYVTDKARAAKSGAKTEPEKTAAGGTADKSGGNAAGKTPVPAATEKAAPAASGAPPASAEKKASGQ